MRGAPSFAIASDTHSHYGGRRRRREGSMVHRPGVYGAVLGGVLMAGGSPALAADAASVIETYADIAHAKYQDSLTTAAALEKAIDTLIAAPTDANLKAARQAC